MHRSNGSVAAAPPPMAGYWVAAPTLVLAMFAVVAVRLHEFVPLARLLRPVLLISILGTAYLYSQSSARAKKDIWRDPIVKLVAVYFIWIFLTIPTALWQGLAFSTWRGLLPSVLMLVAIQLCAPQRHNLDRMQSGFVVFILIYAIYAQTFGRSWNGRLEAGGMYDSNDMASLLSIGFPLAAGMLARATPGRDRMAALLACVALALGVIASGSRGGTLALLAGIVVFAFGFRGARGPIVIVALVVFGAIGWVTAPSDFRERMVSLSDLENDYNYTSQSGRKQVWARGRGYIMENPVLGVGAGNFPIAEGPGLAELGLTGKWSAAHNAYIQSYAELGFTGGTIFVGLLLLAAARARRMWRVSARAAYVGTLDRPELLGSLAAFAAGGYFLSHAYFPPAFALLGMIAFAGRVQTARPSMAIQQQSQPAPVKIVGQRGGLAARVPASIAMRSSTRGGGLLPGARH